MQRELLEEDRVITAQAVIGRFLGTDATSKTLKDIFQYHNKKFRRSA